MEAGLDEISFYDPTNFVWPFGAHACVTEVDVETGRVDVVRYIAVDDCGPAINPLLIEGQIHGGIVHALGQALYEQVVYDEDGQLVTGTFVDYALPSAADVPSFETDRTETPSPTNTLGVKGVGEAATIACSPAVVSSVLDALAPLGVTEIDMPLTPMRVWDAIQAGEGRCVVIPAEFDYVAPDSLDAALERAARRRRGRQGARRRPLAAAADEAAAGRAVAARRPARACPASRASSASNGAFRIGAMTPPPRRRDARRPRARGDGGGDDRRPAGAQPRHARRLDRPRRPGLRHAGGDARGRGHDDGPGSGRRARGRGRRLLPGLPDDGPATTGRSSPASRSPRSTATGTRTGSSTAVARTGRWSRSARSSRRPATARARTSGSASPTWPRCRCARRPRSRRCAARPLDAGSIAAAAEQAAEGTDPPGDLNATPDYKRHLARVLCRRVLEEAAAAA